MTYLYSDDMLSDAVEQLVKDVKVNNKYDIPYVAGYNTVGDTVYIDKDVPKSFRAKDGKKYSLYKYLITHEVVEKVFEETLKLNYFFAHQIALRIERQAVEADGWSWDEYDELMQQYIKEVAHEKINIVPIDIDFQPYKDSKDYKLIEHMKSKMTKPVIKEMAFIQELIK